MYEVVGTAQTRAFRVLWMLEELGLEYKHLDVAPRSEAILKYNPTGKVPVLLVGGEPIIDSTAIITYLADKHGAVTGRMTWPAGTLERARQDAMTHFVLDELDAVLWTGARHTFILPEEKRLPEIKESLRWEFERSQIVLLERMGDGPFLCGDRMTVPDIIAAHCVRWAMVAKFPVNAEFAAYGKRLSERAAYKRAAAASRA
ncbi:MAG TPA: glutathione S-transferase family protein [Aliiroseovarius sp.]|nr:glutathione S-transferase family protein [Aliiroseovarius sp.]